MGLFKRIAIGSTAVVVAFVSCSPAIADPAALKDNTGAFYVSGLTANGRSVVGFPNAQKTINPSADACGRIVIRNSSSNPLLSVTSILLDGTAVDTSALPLDTLSRCINGVAEINHPANFKTPDGSFVLIGNTGLSQHSVSFPGVSLSRNVNVNSCGFLKLTSSAQYPLTGTITVDGTSFDTTTVSMSNPPICRNNVLYLPQ